MRVLLLWACIMFLLIGHALQMQLELNRLQKDADEIREMQETIIEQCKPAPRVYA